MGALPSSQPGRRADRTPLSGLLHAVRRLLNLHGSAVDNAAASVRADDAARDDRDAAADAVAMSAARVAREITTTDSRPSRQKR